MTTNPLVVPPRRKTVVIYGGDVEAELEALLEQIADAGAEVASDKRKKQVAIQLAEEYDAKRAGAPRVEVVLEAIPDVESRKLQDDCPARKGKPQDEMWGFDIDRFVDLLVPEMLVSPEVTEEQWSEFRAQVSASAWGELRTAAFDLFSNGVDLGKSSAVSFLRQRLEDGTKP